MAKGQPITRPASIQRREDCGPSIQDRAFFEILHQAAGAPASPLPPFFSTKRTERRLNRRTYRLVVQ